MITRRRVVIGAGFAVITRPTIALTQQVKQGKVIGYLANNPDPRVVPTYQAFVETLRRLNWIEGQNLQIRIRTSNNDDRLFPALAEQLVRDKVDVIVTTGAASTRAAKQATKTIPIVFGSTANPVELGLVKSLSKPGENVTGMAFFSLELGPKRLQMLKEIAPKAARIARLYSASNPHMSPAVAREPDAAARELNITLEHIPVTQPQDLPGAFEAAVESRAAAVTVEQDALFVREKTRERLAQLAIEHRLPLMGPDRRYARSGALVAYGENFEAMYRRAAVFVDRILRGEAKPADIPVEQPTIVETFVNLRTAQLLGITLPASILVAAGENLIK